MGIYKTIQNLKKQTVARAKSRYDEFKIEAKADREAARIARKKYRAEKRRYTVEHASKQAKKDVELSASRGSVFQRLAKAGKKSTAKGLQGASKSIESKQGDIFHNPWK